jgi:hypothetical protein
MAHDVFVSYAVEDKGIADALVATLEANGIKCWIAPRDVLPGVDYAEALVDAIGNSSLMILVLSSSSNNSPHVRREVERAAQKIPILTFRIDATPPSRPMKFFIGGWGWLDAWTPTPDKHLQRLTDTVNLILSTDAGLPRMEREEPALASDAASPSSADRGETKRRAPDILPQTRERSGLTGRLRSVLGRLGRPTMDRLHFSVNSPRAVHPAAHFVIDVWAHLEHQRDEVMKRAREAVERGVHLVSKGPVGVARGTVILVRLGVEGLAIEDPEDEIVWAGEIANATFLLAVPNDAKEGPRPAVATMHAAGLQIAKVHFVVDVSRAAPEGGPLLTQSQPHHKAFASYASADRNEVLSRIQGIQTAAPQLDVFFDVLSLRAGQDWEQALWETIPVNDIFYLFWSLNAKESHWVEKEWRCALETKGLDFIAPVPLVSPELVPPPPELASKHFDDWTLAFKRGSGR